MARTMRLAVPVLLVLLLAWQCVFAVQVIISDALDFSVQREMVFWGVEGKKPTQAEVDAAQTRMEQAVSLWPLNPDYLALLARLHAWQGQIATSRSAANEQYSLAISTMHLSLLERSGNPYSWAQYAEYLATQQDKRLELAIVVEKVKGLGPGDLKLQQRVQALVRP